MKDQEKINKKVSNLEDILSLRHMGPLYIDPKFKKPGFEYCLVATDPQTMAYYERLGFVAVIDEDMLVGDNHASSARGIGSSVAIPSKCGQTLVLMAMPEDDWKLLERAKRNRAKELEKALGHLDGIASEYQIGDIKMGTKRIS